MCITSDGKKYEKRLAKAQRKLAHKQELSSNRNKQRISVARLHEKITNIGELKTESV